MLSTSLESPWSKETKQVGKEWHSRGCVILWCSFVRFKLVFNAKNEYRINVHNFMLMQIQSRCSFTFPTSPRTQIKHSNWPINLKVQFSPVGWQNTVCSHLICTWEVDRRADIRCAECHCIQSDAPTFRMYVTQHNIAIARATHDLAICGRGQ